MNESTLRALIRETILAEANLTAGQLFKRSSAVDTYVKKIESGEPFELVGGGTIVISSEDNEDLLSALKAYDPVAFNKAWSAGVMTSDGVQKSSGMLQKTGEFGGKGSGKFLEKEAGQISQIQETIDQLAPVDINLGQRTAKSVVAIENVDGTPKADAVLKDFDGAIVGAISLKSADSPPQMQQWGGIGKFAEHPEIKSFVDDLKQVQQNSPTGRIDVAYYRVLKDEELARKLCYGDGSSRVNQCDVIIASTKPIDINPSGDIVATNVFYSPEIPSGDWEPTLWATFRTGRGTGLGLKDIRVGCYPKGWGNTRANEPLPASGAPQEKSTEVTPEVTEAIIRNVVREMLISEAFTKTDEDRIGRAHAKRDRQGVEKRTRKQSSDHARQTIQECISKQ